MYPYNRHALKSSLGIISPVGVVTDIVSLVGNLWGSGQVYGADFENRKTQIQAWATARGLGGTNARYIDPNILQSLSIEDPGHPSAYSFSNQVSGWNSYGVWQSDIPYYFDAVRDAIAGVSNNNPYASLATQYVNQVRGGSGVSPTPPPPSPTQSSMSPILIIGLIGAAAIAFSSKQKRRR